MNLIGDTTTKVELTIRSKLDEENRSAGRKVSGDQMDGLSIELDKFHGEWNYSILPRWEIVQVTLARLPIFTHCGDEIQPRPKWVVIEPEFGA